MEIKSNEEDRRKSARVDAAFTLVYSVDKPYSLRISLGLMDEVDALMLNLSDSGMAIVTKHDIPLATALNIKFNIIDLRLAGDVRWRKMEIVAEVTSNVKTEFPQPRPASHRIGLRFVNILNSDKQAISNFVNRNILPPS